MHLTKKLFTTVSLILLLSGCVTRGQDFPSDLDWIVKKQTTQSDVFNLLGQPTFIGEVDGRKTWTYGFYNYRLLGDNRIKELKLYWTEDNRVAHYSFKQTMEPTKKDTALFEKKAKAAKTAH